jgi:hypothetical protein
LTVDSFSLYIFRVNRRDVLKICRFVSYGSAPAMVAVMVLAYAGLLARGVARVDVFILLAVGLLATLGAWATSSYARRRG